MNENDTYPRTTTSSTRCRRLGGPALLSLLVALAAPNLGGCAAGEEDAADDLVRPPTSGGDPGTTGPAETEGDSLITGGETAGGETTGGETTGSSATDPDSTDTTSGSATDPDPSDTICGDGVVDEGEACDEGEANDDAAACTSQCQIAVCGDGLHQLGVEACDDGGDSDSCDSDCTLVVCGDQHVNLEAGEECDDGDAVDGDGCESSCILTRVIDVAAARLHSCALLASGVVRCWGSDMFGELGSGKTGGNLCVEGLDPSCDPHDFCCVGDEGDEMPPADVEIGASAIAAPAGGLHGCALVQGGKIRCWGRNTGGQLGLGHTDNIGDNELPAEVEYVEIAGVAIQVAAASGHTCALLKKGNQEYRGTVHCWGSNRYGRTGYGLSGENDTLCGGDYSCNLDEDCCSGDQPGEMPRPAVDLGDQTDQVTQIAIGVDGGHTCVLLSGGAVRCWGYNNGGQLGYGDTDSRGDDETEFLDDVPIGEPVIQLAAGDVHTCALLESGGVRCWGLNNKGQLGTGDPVNRGDDPGEVAALEDVPILHPYEDPEIVQITAGGSHTCALLDDGRVRCWGYNEDVGRLGYGHSDNIGDQPGEMPPPDVELAGEDEFDVAAVSLSAGKYHTCALLSSGRVRCWGGNSAGELGYGHSEPIGDDEVPASLAPAADVPVF